MPITTSNDPLTLFRLLRRGDKWLEYLVKVAKRAEDVDVRPGSRLTDTDIVKAYLATVGYATSFELTGLILAARRSNLSRSSKDDVLSAKSMANRAVRQLEMAGLVTRRLENIDGYMVYVFYATDELKSQVYDILDDLIAKVRARMNEVEVEVVSLDDYGW